MAGSLCDAVAKEVEGDGLTMLINNAGVNPRGTLETITEQGMMDTLRTNTVSPLMITKVRTSIRYTSQAGSTSWLLGLK